jgi:hypothetical protein
MHRLTILPAALALFALSAVAQTQSAAQAGASATGSTTAGADKNGVQAASSSSAATSAQAGRDSANLAGGTAMQATLTHPVDCKKNKPGDAVFAKNTEAVTSNGQVVIPKGSRLVGHVTEAKQHQKQSKNHEGQDSSLGIVWDKAILKGGQEVPLDASIQALASAQGQASSTINDADVPLSGGAIGSGSASGRGALGGVGAVGATAGGAVGSATRPVSSVGSATSGVVSSTANGAVGSTANVAGSANASTASTVGGLNAAGQFVTNSRGVFGLGGLSLASMSSTNSGASLITSSTQNVHLDSGTRMLLVAQGQAEGSASKGGSHSSREAKEPKGSNPQGARPEHQDQQP